MRYRYGKIWALLMGVVCSFAAPLPQDADFRHAAPWYFPLALVGFGLIGVLLISSIQVFSKKLTEHAVGSLSSLELINLAAISMLAYGLGCAVVGMLFGSPLNWSWEIPVSASVGILIGVHVVKIVTQ